jgi:hypothetical protein
MGKIGWKMGWNITASIGLLVFSQTAIVALDSRVTMAAGAQADRYAQDRYAQVSAPAASETTPPAAAKEPPGPSSPAAAAPPDASSSKQPDSAPTKQEVVKAAPTASRCALRFMAAEIAGKLKGRKWKEFRQEECGESTTEAVFPSVIAPKYSGANVDKARMLTCADQFNANKSTNGNGGMKWIDKGGGYYGECVSRLKG